MNQEKQQVKKWINKDSLAIIESGEIVRQLNQEYLCGKTCPRILSFSGDLVEVCLKIDFQYPYNERFQKALIINDIYVSRDFQRQGIGSTTINALHEVNHHKLTVVQFVRNPHLARWLERNNWQRHNQNDLSN